MDLTRWLDFWPTATLLLGGLVLGWGLAVVLAGHRRDQRLAQQERECVRLQRSEHELRTAMQATGGGHWVWDLVDKTVAFHGPFYDEFDVPQDAAIPVRQAWRRLRHPNQTLSRTRIERHDDSRAPLFEAEFLLRTRAGHRRWIRSHGRAISLDARGLPERMAGMHFDVTAGHDAEAARHVSQEKFESIFLTLPDAAGISRISDGLFLEINPAYTSTVGYTRAEVLGRTAGEIGIWANAQERERLLAHYHAHGQVLALPMTARHRDGHLVKGSMSTRKVTIGHDDCFVFVFHDTTRQDAIHAQLQAANALLRAAGRMARLGEWALTFDGRAHIWSEVCRNIHGLDAGAAIPEKYVDVFVAPPYRDALRHCLRECRDKAVDWDLVLQIMHTDGRWLWVRFMGEPVLENGRVVGIRGVAQDIDADYRRMALLQQSEERFSRMFHLMPDALGITRQSDGHYLDVNDAWVELLGRTREEALGHSAVELGVLTAQDRSAMIEQTRQSGHAVAYEVTLHHRDGRAITGLHSMRPIDIGGEPCWLFGFKDISERKSGEALLKEREALLSLALGAAALGLWDWNLQTQTITANPRWIALNGLAQGQTSIRLDQWKARIHPEDLPRVFDSLKLHMAEPSIPYDVIRRTRPGGEPVRWIRDMGQVVLRDTQGQPQRMVGVNMDVTDQQEHEQQLQRIAHSDPLTGLPNRFVLADRLQQSMHQVDRVGGLLGVAYLDLDGFKPVNDRLGHATGDALLVELAQRLQAQMRTSDTVARLGGDEFVLLLTGLDTLYAAEQALIRIMAAVSAPYLLQGEWISVTASIGATLYPQDLSDADALLRHADQAMYVAKQSGRNRYQFFDTAQDQAWRERSQQRARLRQAMEQGELVLHYQPKADMLQQRVIGAEALVRWQHPELGLLAPDSFLAALEDSDLEVPFGEWVIAAALAQMQAWQTQGLTLPVSINITARHLQTPAFAQRMLAQLTQYPELHEGLLEIEITESAALHDLDTALQVLEQLHTCGVRVALDDFGTGYSSLTYLRRLPIDTLKIDRSFVRDMLIDPEDLAIVVAVIGLSRSFGLAVIAEGVESLDQGQRLLQLGCTQAQGYGIARPMPAERLRQWMSDGPAVLWSGTV